ncbi:MAG: hypothetical protein GY794_25740 [bacterium]|nr:hypothetical protein [bacterium]
MILESCANAHGRELDVSSINQMHLTSHMCESVDDATPDDVVRSLAGDDLETLYGTLAALTEKDGRCLRCVARGDREGLFFLYRPSGGTELVCRHKFSSKEAVSLLQDFLSGDTAWMAQHKWLRARPNLASVAVIIVGAVVVVILVLLVIASLVYRMSWLTRDWS